MVLGLNTQLGITFFNLVSIGSLNEAFVSPREVFRAAVAGASYAVILMHNHPSGDPWPSRGEVISTRALQKAGAILGIRLLDHVIIGDGTFISLKDLGIFDSAKDEHAVGMISRPVKAPERRGKARRSTAKAKTA